MRGTCGSIRVVSLHTYLHFYLVYTFKHHPLPVLAHPPQPFLFYLTDIIAEDLVNFYTCAKE